MFDNMNIGVSRNAVDKFRERIDPTAKATNIIDYLKQAELSPSVRSTLERYGYTLSEYMMMGEALYLRYLHVTFVVARKRGKGKNQICVVTCF